MATSNKDQWSTSGLDFFLDLSRAGSGGLRIRIEEGLREAIRSERLPHGTRLPATRSLALDLGVSRGTVLQAYTQLAAEGWIAGQRGSSTVVTFKTDPQHGATAGPASRPLRWRFDLRPGRPDSSSFPRTEWLRAYRRAFAAAPDDALGYGAPQGQLVLRNELAGYLSRARGLRVTASELLVTTGFTQSLGLVARALAGLGVTRMAIEEPSMPLHRAIVRAAGHQLVTIPVDADGARLDELGAATGVGAVVLTPNRQHPLGATLSATRRSRLLEWARMTNAYVIEDDYDGEFRYDNHPIGSLQGLDPGVVIYAGTASKTLAPALRLGWLALPASLQNAVTHEKELADWHNGVFEQLAFAELLRSGGYDRHIRKMRLCYRRRRDVLTRALESRPDLEIRGGAAGLNILIPLPDQQTEANAIAAAAAAGAGIDGLATGGYYEHGGPAGLIIGYAAAPEHAFRQAVETLVSALTNLSA